MNLFDRPDIIRVAVQFAEMVEAGDYESAEELIALGETLALGGVIVFGRPEPDRCRALTRHGDQCCAWPGERGLCAVHRRMGQAFQAQHVPDEGASR